MNYRKPTTGLMTAVSGLVLVCYVLSLGPVCLLLDRGRLPSESTGRLYEPILWLESRSPAGVEAAVTWYTRLWGGDSALTTIRERPYWQRHSVGDLLYRQENGQRIFYPEPAKCSNWITTTVAPRSWDDLGGPGKFEICSLTQTLVIFQSRKVHTEIAAFLDDLRMQKRALSRGRELDFPSMHRILARRDGIIDNEDILPDALKLVMLRNHGWRLGSDSFGNDHEFVEFLKRQPPSRVRPGIVYEFWNAPFPDYEEVRVHDERIEQLARICQARDIDLLIKSGGANNSPTYAYWKVRASNSVYHVPE